MSRKESELLCIARLGYAVSHAADRMQHVNTELFAQAADENLDRVRITVEILIVEMFHNLAARHDTPGLVHEITTRFPPCAIDTLCGMPCATRDSGYSAPFIFC